jgi:hypothetical protein
MSRLSRQCGVLNILQPYRPPRPVTGIALLTLLMNRSLDALQDFSPLGSAVAAPQGNLPLPWLCCCCSPRQLASPSWLCCCCSPRQLASPLALLLLPKATCLPLGSAVAAPQGNLPLPWLCCCCSPRQLASLLALLLLLPKATCLSLSRSIAYSRQEMNISNAA